VPLGVDGVDEADDLAGKMKPEHLLVPLAIEDV
jgi:hypothetical protein